MNKARKNNEITLRKFLLLVRELPDNSAFRRWYENKDNRSFVENDDRLISQNFNKMK